MSLIGMDDNELEVDGKAIEMWKSMSKEETVFPWMPRKIS